MSVSSCPENWLVHVALARSAGMTGSSFHIVSHSVVGDHGLVLVVGEGPPWERRSCKTSGGLGFNVAQCHFHSILLFKASDRVSTHSRDGK